ncbi:MAG: enoyl-CoA hydratase/isomerase family protein [Acidimicrobiales bacterium]
MSGHPGLAGMFGPTEALDIVRDEFELGLSSGPRSRPALVVEIAAGPDLEALELLAPELPCVLIGVTDNDDAAPPKGFDILLSSLGGPRPWVHREDLEAAVRTLVGSITASPQASVALVQLLRLGAELSVRDALVAESFAYSMLQAGPVFGSWLAGRPEPAMTISETDPVVVRRDGAYLEIRLNRPEVRNALNAAMRDALLSALEIVVIDHSIASAHISGEGPAFCAGGDLKEFGLAEDPVTAHAVRVSRSVGALLSRCSDRVAVHVHGACVGAGIEIPAFSGHVAATPDATFSLPEVGFGLIPGAGGTVSIPRRIGRQRTAYMAITGETITAATALQWHLIDEIHGT